MPETKKVYKLQRISLRNKATPIGTPFPIQDIFWLEMVYIKRLSFHMSLLAQNYRSFIFGGVKLSTISAFASYDDRNGRESGARNYFIQMNTTEGEGILGTILETKFPTISFTLQHADISPSLTPPQMNEV